MRQALHIFRKDVRFLWAPALVVLAMTAIFAWSRCVDPSGFPQYFADGEDFLSVIWYLLVLAWWYFIACAIQQEQPAGDRQFWVTRPYRWQSILAAKALLIAVSINVPYLISDWVILSANGFSPVRTASNLLVRQVALFAILLLPAVALAAAVRSLSEIALTVMAGVALYGFYPTPQGIHVLQRFQEYFAAAILAAGVIVVLAWQYAGRRTGISRVALAAILGLSAAFYFSRPYRPVFPRAQSRSPIAQLLRELPDPQLHVKEIRVEEGRIP